MTILNEPAYDDSALISEAPGTRSREQVTILAGSGADRVLTPNMVLGKVELAGATAAADAGNTGDGAMGAITVSAGAKEGVYSLVIIEPAANAGAFQVEDPDGNVIGTGNVAAAFSVGGLAFTLADGATDFAAGDRFTITVAAGSGKFVQLDLTASDGSQRAAGVLRAGVTAPDGVDAQAVAYVRDAELKDAKLVWPSGATGSQKTAAKVEMNALGMIFR